MQSITIPFAIQKENSTQEIITKKIPIQLLTGKIKTESEWKPLQIVDVDTEHDAQLLLKASIVEFF